jgi:hypothetical protein
MLPICAMLLAILIGVNHCLLPTDPVAPIERSTTIVIIVENSAALDQSGTPGQIRRQDMHDYIELLLNSLPAGANIHLIAYAETAAVLAAGNPATIEGALDALSDQSTLEATTPALAQALRIAESSVQRDPPEPVVVFAFIASPPNPIALQPVELVQTYLVGLGIDLVQLQAPAAVLGAQALPLAADNLSDLAPQIDRLVDAYCRAIRQAVPETRSPLHGSLQHLLTNWGKLADHYRISNAAAKQTTNWLLPGSSLALLFALIVIYRRNRRRRLGQASRPPELRVLSRSHQTTDHSHSHANLADVPTERRPLADLPAPADLHLSVDTGSTRQCYGLTAGDTLIGRSPHCTIVVEHSQIAPIHARLSVTDNRCTISDMGSTTGTFLGTQRRRLTPEQAVEIAEGVAVRLGEDVQLQVYRGTNEQHR